MQKTSTKGTFLAKMLALLIISFSLSFQAHSGVLTPPGNALNFDGVNDFVNCGNSASVQISTGTVEAWIKTANAGTSFRSIVTKGGAWSLFLQDNILIAYD